MQHLETERIAAFDHEAFTVEELAHLAACTVCRTERNAFAALNQRSMHLADAPAFPPAPRLTNWESLSQRLRAEGLMAGESSSEVVYTASVDTTSNEVRFENVMRALNRDASANQTVRRTVEPTVTESWWQRAKPRSNGEFFRIAAAAVLCVVAGAGANQMRNDRAVSAATSTSAESSTAGVVPFDIGPTGYSSAEQATKALANSEKEFDRAITWLTANDPSATRSDMLRKRLAAQDRISAAAYEALQSSPQDRVLDHHYRAAAAARELTLKQLGISLPAGRSLERF